MNDKLIKAHEMGSNKLKINRLGFGAATLGGLFSKLDVDVAKSTLKLALKYGVNYVDTAPYYGMGRSERVVGDILRSQEYVVSTKVGRILKPGAMENPASIGWPDALPFHVAYDYTYDGIMRSFEDSLQRMGLDKIDILYVHDIGQATHGLENKKYFSDLSNSGYKALEKLRKSKLVKAIGLGVNEKEVCLDSLKIGDWDVFLLAGRYTLLEQSPLDDLFIECEKTNTSIVIGGPFNSGILVGGDKWDYGSAPQEILKKVASLEQIANQFNVPLPAAALQFPLAHRVVASVIPGLRTPSELNDTLNWATTSIPPEFWQCLKADGLLREDAPTPISNPYLAD